MRFWEKKKTFVTVTFWTKKIPSKKHVVLKQVIGNLGGFDGGSVKYMCFLKIPLLEKK